ncbi:cell wall-active antibiotics response protein LiaF [Paenibacillus puldeungensis]|uniref:Cell wall-active antibiotics response protein LiaF n=1 Tax=Paenibacillus puldeungensis TaxID=696536 RepID=A0ABW3S0A1_9BACL
MDKHKRFLAIALIGIGVLMLVGKWLSFFTIVALFLIAFGIVKIRQGEQVKTGYILMAIGGGMILLEHFMLVIAVLMISLGWYYAKIRKTRPEGNFIQKQNITSSIHWDLDPWSLRNTSMWHVFGELDIDLSLAIAEGQNTILMFQGIVGDIDLVVPEDYGVEIEAFVMFGQIDFGKDKETGMLNRLYWKSPNYELREQKVKIMISYLVGDVDIRLT